MRSSPVALHNKSILPGDRPEAGNETLKCLHGQNRGKSLLVSSQKQCTQRPRPCLTTVADLAATAAGAGQARPGSPAYGLLHKHVHV